MRENIRGFVNLILLTPYKRPPKNIYSFSLVSLKSVEKGIKSHLKSVVPGRAGWLIVA